jgi:DGQHR domain-containing protein
MDRIPALRITQGKPDGESRLITIFVTAMTLSQLQKYTDVDAWAPDNPEGYQRPVVERRLREIARYVLEGKGVLPTSILLGTRPLEQDDRNGGAEIKMEGFSDNESPVDSGYLVIPEGATLWLIDGQHRYSGVKFAYERGMNPELASYAFPVSVMSDIDQYTEMEHFNIVNTMQKKMPTDIVDRHLVQMQAIKGMASMVSSGARGEKDYIRASATKLIDQLNDSPGVWQDEIAIPGIEGRDTGLVRHHAMVVSIEPFMRDSWVRGRTDEDKVKVIINYWNAIRELWPEAIDNPKDHRLQATSGIYSLHLVLPVLIQRCIDKGMGLTTSDLKAVLGEANLAADFWHKEYGDPLTLGTGMASIRALAHTIIDAIPTSSNSGVRI